MKATGVSLDKRSELAGRDMPYLGNLTEIVKTSACKLDPSEGEYFKNLEEKVKMNPLSKFLNIQENAKKTSNHKKQFADLFSRSMGPIYFLLLWYAFYFCSCLFGACMLNDNYTKKASVNRNFLENSTDMIQALVKNLPQNPTIKYDTGKMNLFFKVEDQILKLKCGSYTNILIPLITAYLTVIFYTIYLTIAMVILRILMDRNKEKEGHLRTLATFQRFNHLTLSLDSILCARKKANEGINATDEEKQQKIAKMEKEIKNIQSAVPEKLEETEKEIEKVKFKKNMYEKIFFAHTIVSMLLISCFQFFIYYLLNDEMQVFNKNSSEWSEAFASVKTLIWRLIKK